MIFYVQYVPLNVLLQIASKIERDKWKYRDDSDLRQVVAKPTNNIQEQKKVDNLKDKFDELFA